MSNSILTIQMITREALRLFKNSNALLKNVDRQYDEDFARKGAKIGSSLRIRLPNDFTVRRGAAASVQGTNEQQVGLVVANQIGVDIQFSSAERALSLDDYSERILKPAINSIAGIMAADIMGAVDGLVPSTTLYTDTQTPVSNFVARQDGNGNILQADINAFLKANAVLNQRSAPGNRKIILDPLTEGRMVGSLAGLLNPSADISEQYLTGQMKRGLGFDWMMDQTVIAHTTGAYSSAPTVSGAGQTGNTLVVSALSGPLNAGDVFTMPGVYAVNRVTKQTLPDLMQFTVTANAAAGATAISIYPALTPPVSGAAVQYQTVSASPANGAQINVLTNSGSQYRCNLAYVPEAITLVTADLELPQGVHEAYRETYDNTSMRIVTAYNVATDQFITRLDVLYGYKILRPEWCVRVADAI
ncbi:P22 phage major capsid protein family protein [Tolumonas lignilytica]|uniref:P22 phage major capsid protein family protein n=1 Tax=Tolumonas lignilytica TaxID=1283284 RepID=UPI000464A285|nr:P22 phage major capsid protein family protein [Tolumonas lignilytica]